MKRLFAILTIILIISISIFGCGINTSTTTPKNQLYVDITTNKDQYIKLLTNDNIIYYIAKSTIESSVDKSGNQAINATIYEIKENTSSIIKTDLVFNYDPHYSQESLRKKMAQELEKEYGKEKIELLAKDDYDHLLQQKQAQLLDSSLKYYAGIQMTKIHTSEYSYDGTLINHQDKDETEPIYLNEKSLRYTIAQDLYKLKNNTDF